MINIDNETRKLSQASIVIGYKQENKAENIEFEIPDYLKEYGKKICFKTKTGKVFSKMFDNITSNIFTFTRTETQYGELDATIQFFKTENEDIIIYKTSTLHIIFKDAVICEDEVSPDEPKIPILEDLIEKVTDLNTTIIENEGIRNNNENTRISNENERITNEKERVNNENIRIENEEKRNKDYTSLTKKVDNLEEDTKLIKCQFVEGQSSGNSIHIEDSSNLEMNWKIKGGHRQETREGYNLFDIQKWLDNSFSIQNGTLNSKSANSISITSTNGDCFTQTYAMSKDTIYNKSQIDKFGREVEPNTNYTFYVKKNASIQGSNHVFFYDEDYNYLGLKYNNTTSDENFFNFTTPENAKYMTCRLGISSGENTVEFTNIMLLKNTYTTDTIPVYEPFGSSPSPDYPSEVETVNGSVKIDVVNKNLFEIPDIPETEKYGVKYAVKNGVLSLNGTATGGFDITLMKNISIKKGIYTHSTSPFPKGAFFSLDNKSETMLNSNLTSVKLNLKEDTTYSKYIVWIDNKTVFDNIKIEMQLEKGATRTKIVEHQSQTAIMPIQQPMLEGDYIADVEHHEWGKIESYNGETITTDYISTTGQLTTGATVYYKLDETIDLELTPEQKAIRENKLYTYKNVTNVSVNNELASIEVEYKKDLETQLDEKQDTLTAGNNIKIENNVISATIPTTAGETGESGVELVGSYEDDNLTVSLLNEAGTQLSKIEVEIPQYQEVHYTWDGTTGEDAKEIFQMVYSYYKLGKIINVDLNYNGKMYKLTNISNPRNMANELYCQFMTLDYYTDNIDFVFMQSVNAVLTVNSGIVSEVSVSESINQFRLIREFDGTNGALPTNNTKEYTPTMPYEPSTKKYVDETHYKNFIGYSSSKTQILKNVNGVLQWVDG